jgi:hypothetical protein
VCVVSVQNGQPRYARNTVRDSSGVDRQDGRARRQGEVSAGHLDIEYVLADGL